MWILTKRFLAGLINFLIIVFICAFAVLNRHEASLIWNPFGSPLEVPLYMLAVSFMIFGFILGTSITWLSGAVGKHEHKVKPPKTSDLRQKIEASRQKYAHKAG